MEQIRLDIIPKGLMPVCHSSQYDKGRVIRLNLVDGLQGYTLTDETVTLNVRKPDNNIVTAGVNVVSGASYVDIVTTEQMTACEGENLCEIVITKGDVKIASLNFKMKVEVDPLKDGIESETEIHNLETQIAEIDARIVPPIVAEEVSNQYDSENVIFDDTPTENHGTGYTVTSEGIKNYVDNKPNALVDLTDVDIDNPTSNQALVWDTTEEKWINGEVSTVGGLNDLNDVTIDDTSLADKQELVYNGTAEVFENKTTRVELTQAEYDALANPLPNVDYYITDAPSMQGTSADLSYDGDTDSVYDVVEEVKSDVADNATAISKNRWVDATSQFTKTSYFDTTQNSYFLFNEALNMYAVSFAVKANTPDNSIVLSNVPTFKNDIEVLPVGFANAGGLSVTQASVIYYKANNNIVLRISTTTSVPVFVTAFLLKA